MDSLLSEQYEDAEIILVNDGSKDSSAEICRGFLQKSRNIRYIEKENGGVSAARNRGLGAARGEYVLFVDSDDYVASDFFALLDEALNETSSDWVQFSYCLVDGSKQTERRFDSMKIAGRNKLMPYIVEAICNKRVNSPWSKLYRKDIIEAHRIRFPEGASIAEDRVFNIHYSMYVQSWAVSDRILYYVDIGDKNSLSRKRRADRKEQSQITDSYFRKVLLETDIPKYEKEHYQQAYNFGNCRSVYHSAKLLHQDGVGWWDRQRMLYRLCTDISRKKMKYPGTVYCLLITLPVRLRLTPGIDAVAWKLTR